MQAEHANTPLRRLYFVVQVQLMTSDENNGFQNLFDEQLNELLETFEDQQILSELKFIDQLVKQLRFHEAMKSLKKLVSLEKQIFDTIETSFPFDRVSEPQPELG